MMWLILRDGRPVESCRWGWFARAWAAWLNAEPDPYPAVYEVSRG